ncbi:MAG: hypothetical protein OEQ53_18140, partial [Saprospiraceae bacterium]|nr:hypothetical protein [Saprospiraceae bacterium]
MCIVIEMHMMDMKTLAIAESRKGSSQALSYRRRNPSSRFPHASSTACPDLISLWPDGFHLVDRQFLDAGSATLSIDLERPIAQVADGLHRHV